MIADLALGSTVDDGFGRTDTLVSIENLNGSELDDTLLGDSVANVLRGNAGHDILEGRVGDDLIEGGDGDDRIDGGEGSDTASYQSAALGVRVNLNLAFNNTIGAGIDQLISIENLAGSGFDDMLTGNAGANSLAGGDGDDTLEGAAGDDLLDGGAGSDTASYSTAGAAVVVSLAMATAQNTGGAGTDTFISIENLTGSRYNDTLTGNEFANVLTGGAGNDLLDGAAGLDTASYATATAGVVVNLTLTGAQNTGGAGADTLVGIENLTGSGYADTLTGDSLANVLSGGFGDDILKGGDGSDTLEGGAGNDRIEGGTGVDTASYQGSLSAVSVNLNLTTAQRTGGQGSDRLVSIENLTGSSFDDTLIGNGSGNILVGGSGADRLYGRGGSDTLEGGDGADIFYFDTALNATTNVDQIRDFSVADDTVHLQRSIFSGLTLGELSSSAFVTGTAALDADDRIIYDRATGKIYYDADGNGAGAQVLFAQVTAGIALTNADFIVG